MCWFICYGQQMHNSTAETCMKLIAESKSLDRLNMSACPLMFRRKLAADLTRCSLFERCTVLIGGTVSSIGSLNGSFA